MNRYCKELKLRFRQGSVPMPALTAQGTSHPSNNCRPAHLFAQRRLRCQASEYASGTTCPVCLTQFWSNRRLCRHLQHDSTACLARMVEHDYRSVDCVPPKDSELCQSLPAVRLSGPLLPPAKPLEEIANELVESADFAERVSKGWHSPAGERWLEASVFLHD